MALTVGTGPFGREPAGEFNREMPEREGLIYFEGCPRRMRARFGGETIVDSRRAMLLHENRHLPVLYFPREDVRTDLLEPSDRSTRCPWKGDASYWSVRAGEAVATDAVWGYPEPIEGAPPLAGYLAFEWGEMDEWLEEDESARVHIRDPYTRVDVLDTSCRVRVSFDGEPLAETERARVIYETSLPPRWYIPPEDVRTELLVDSETTSNCAYKGTASYKSLRDAGEEGEDIAWYYPDPAREAERVREMICFWNERADIELDGEAAERPATHWYGGRREAGPKGLARS